MHICQFSPAGIPDPTFWLSACESGVKKNKLWHTLAGPGLFTHACYVCKDHVYVFHMYTPVHICHPTPCGILGRIWPIRLCYASKSLKQTLCKSSQLQTSMLSVSVPCVYALHVHQHLNTSLYMPPSPTPAGPPSQNLAKCL